jgi:hypothetical protein
VGGLAGYNYDGAVSKCYARGAVSGADYVGGLVGKNSFGTIVSNCSATGAVGGDCDVGGLVGSNHNEISNCCASGGVAGDDKIGGLVGSNYGSYGAISNCYAAGDVNGITDTGGLVGYDYASSYMKSFWDSDVNPDVNGIGNANDPNVIGKTTTEMQTESTFTDAGWDFVNTWDICEGTNYPRLVWQIPAADFLCPDGVNFIDYAYLSDVWDTNDANADLDLSGLVDGNDLKLFCGDWLEGF